MILIDQATLKQITPLTKGFGEKFSPNLAMYLRKYPDAIRFFFAGDKDVREWTPERTITHLLYLGFMDGNLLIGSRVAEIIHYGRKAQRWAYPPKNFASGLRDVTVELLPRYVELGKCALDPEHRLYFDSERYVERGDTRTCKWCGQVQARKVIVETVETPVWAPEQMA